MVGSKSDARNQKIDSGDCDGQLPILSVVFEESNFSLCMSSHGIHNRAEKVVMQASLTNSSISSQVLHPSTWFNGAELLCAKIRSPLDPFRTDGLDIH
jgi:hypothetical protein